MLEDYRGTTFHFEIPIEKVPKSKEELENRLGDKLVDEVNKIGDIDIKMLYCKAQYNGVVYDLEIIYNGKINIKFSTKDNIGKSTSSTYRYGFANDLLDLIKGEEVEGNP